MQSPEELEGKDENMPGMPGNERPYLAIFLQGEK
jgi:hypothetical protein